MSAHLQSLESFCFGYTKRISDAAASEKASVPAIETEVSEAVTHVIRIQVGVPQGNLKVLAVQLGFAKDSMVQNDQARQLIDYAQRLVEQKIKVMESTSRR